MKHEERIEELAEELRSFSKALNYVEGEFFLEDEPPLQLQTQYTDLQALIGIINNGIWRISTELCSLTTTNTSD